MAEDAPADLAAELKETKKKLKRMTLKEKGWKKMVDDLEAKVATPPPAASDLAALQGQLQENLQALAEAEAEAASLRQRLASACAPPAADDAGLLAQVEQLEGELQTAKDEAETRIGAIKQKAIQRETKIKDSAKGLVQPLKDENQALKAQLAARDELALTHADHAAQQQALQAQMESLRSELEAAGEARAGLEAELGSRAAAHDSLASEHAALRAAHDSNVEAESSLAAELAAASASSASASETLSSELAEVKAQLSVSEASLAAVQSEMAAAAAEASDALTEQATSRGSLVGEMESLRSELEAARADAAAASAAASAATSSDKTFQSELVELRAALSDRSVALKAAEKAAKKEAMKAKALKAMLEEHSVQAEDQATATQAALESARAEVEAEKGNELNNYRDALGAARVKVQSLEGECIQLRESGSQLEQDLQEQRRVAKEWEGESTRLAEFVEKLSSTSSSSKKALVQLEMELAAAKGQAKDSSQAVSERDEFKTLTARLTSELSNRDAELEELRIKLAHAEGLVGGSRDEAEAAESMYSKLQARLIETEAAKEEMAEALRKRVDLKTTEAAKHGANVERLSAVLESFQIERQQAETRLQEEVRSVSEARDAARQQLAELEAKIGDHSLQTVEQQLRESELSRQALEEQNDTLERQCDRLRGMVEGAVARAATQEQEDGMFVDRRLVTKLLCTYVSSATGQQREVLEVMARILQFDDDAKEVLGLGEAGWSAYLPFGLGAKPQRAQIVKDGDIADEWANFLLSEIHSGDGGPGKDTVTLGVKVGAPPKQKQQGQEPPIAAGLEDASASGSAS